MKRLIISENHDVAGEPLLHPVGNKVKAINLNFHSSLYSLKCNHRTPPKKEKLTKTKH